MKKFTAILLMLGLFITVLALPAQAVEAEIKFDVKEVLYNNKGELEVQGAFSNSGDTPVVAKSLLLVINGQDSPTSAYVRLIKTNVPSTQYAHKLISPGQPVPMTFTFPQAKKIKLMKYTYTATLTVDSPITVVINGKELVMETLPVAENGRTLVPLRAIFQALGADIFWDAPTETVTAKKGSTEVKITIGKAQAEVNGQAVKLDVPAKTIDQRAYVPARFVAEAFGAKVNYDSATKKVTITQ
ncbi:MAG: copper amine oxidase N-terminal domain-containing protein [Clostridia bacterium]|nr:copper amine oxidase N-terminal domain-containing protein [Clostridia bacterium]